MDHWYCSSAFAPNCVNRCISLYPYDPCSRNDASTTGSSQFFGRASTFGGHGRRLAQLLLESFVYDDHFASFLTGLAGAVGPEGDLRRPVTGYLPCVRIR